jgi:hypothetical protein
MDGCGRGAAGRFAPELMVGETVALRTTVPAVNPWPRTTRRMPCLTRGRWTIIQGRSVDIPDLVRLRKAKDRMDREFDQPLDVPALARSVAMSTGHFAQLQDCSARAYSYLMTRRIGAPRPCSGVGHVNHRCVLCRRVHIAGYVQPRFSELVGESPSAYRRAASSAYPGLCHQGHDQTDQNEEAAVLNRQAERMDLKLQNCFISVDPTRRLRSPRSARARSARRRQIRRYALDDG